MHTWLSSQPPLGLPFVINRASPQAVGLVGWWPVLASRGSSVLYSLARPYNGTLQSTTLTWETDSQMGMRLNFPRADAAYISTAFPAPTTGPFTLAGWIRTANAGSYRAILGCSADGGIEWRLNPSEQLELLQESVALVATSSGTVTTAAWAHVALTWASGGAYVFYVNGQAAGSGTNNVTYSAGTFDIGRHGTLLGEGYGGQIADLRVYERSLSAAEVWQLYAPQTRWQLYAPAKTRAVMLTGTIVDPGVASVPAPAVLRPRAVSRPQFTAVLYSPQAEARAVLSGYGALSCTVDTTGDGGGFEMDLPPTVDRSLLKDGSLVVVYKRPPGGVARYKETYIILNQAEQQARRGTRWPKIEGPSLTGYLLGKDFRLINALENETGASVTSTAADDAIRYFINGAMAAGAGNSGTSLGRDLSQIIGLTVETNRSVGPAVTHNGYLQPLDSVIRAIAKKAEEDTAAPMRIRWQVKPKTFNPLTFEVVLHTAPMKATTRVVTRKRGGFGVYRGFDAPAPVILGPAFGTVVESDLERDRTGEYTSVVVAYAAKANRTRTTDSTRALDFPLAFREVFYESTVAINDAGAQTDAAGKLKEGEAREVMRVKLLDSAATRYDADYFLGDIVGVLALDRRWEAEITGEENTVDRGGVNTSLKLKEEE